MVATVASFFPYIREGDTSDLIYTRFALSQAQMGALVIPTSKEAMAQICIALLAPAYTDQARIGKQLTKRIYAICVAASIPPVSELTVTNAITNMRFVGDNYHPIVNRVIVRMICKQSDNTIDPIADCTTLMDPQAIINAGLISTFAGHLLTAARMIFSHHHATSINFAIPVVDRLAERLGNFNPTLQEEIRRFREISPILTRSPYTGLDIQPPENMQIKQ